MFDVVVIGAGSSGAVIAARASEDPDRSVCLLEAGPDYPALLDTPFDLVNSYDNSYTDHDWGFEYTPVAAGQAAPFPRGRVTGGSSAVNTTIALRGMPEDYDHWAALGNPEWAWARVLPAFRRLERDLDFGDRPWHGDAGPISIRRYRDDQLTLPQAAFLDAAASLGYRRCDDANEPDSEGAGPHPMNKLGRVRISTAVGYLAPARIRPNLTIRPGSPVARIITAHRKAEGVELVDGERIEGRLLVLAAGAISSPLILLRSGIGPAGELTALGLEPVADVPGVGRNLADHPATLVVCQARDPAIVDRDAPLMQTILRYTAPGSDQRNDLQIEMLSFTGRRVPGQPAAFAIASVVEWAESRGRVRLSGVDPAAPPVVEPNLCGEEADVERLAGCLLDTLAFADSAPIKDLVEDVTFPRRPVDRESARTIARRFAASGYHPCGTARMGPAGDPASVVDQFGCCHAVEGLVVADASIMPTVPRANTNLTAIMIGEMIGEWLRTRPAHYGL